MAASRRKKQMGLMMTMIKMPLKSCFSPAERQLAEIGELLANQKQISCISFSFFFFFVEVLSKPLLLYYCMAFLLIPCYGPMSF